MTDSGNIGKLRGMEQALRKYHLWKEDFAEAAREYAEAGIPFTSEDVLDVVGLPSGETGQHKNNAVGAMMYGLARRGLIKKTGRHVQSRRAHSHAAELTQWIGAEHDHAGEKEADMWVYEEYEPGMYRVGYLNGTGSTKWVEYYDCRGSGPENQEDARKAVHYLNGGSGG